VVLKSLFEEQIMAELAQNMAEYNADAPDAFDYIRQYTRENTVSDYLKLITEAKKAVDIPVIASINCVSANEWVAFAKSVENAGADALEINVSLFPSDPRKKCNDYEKIYFEVLDQVASLVSLPVALKMSRYSSALANLITRLSWTGKVAGFVLFNRYYRPDFNIDTLDVRSADIFTTPDEIFTTLRWIALLAGNVTGDLVASTGAHDSAGLIKLLLAGATGVQVVSAIYKNGPEYINELIKGLTKWMEGKSFERIRDFRGKLSLASAENTTALQRIQYMKHFGGIS